MNFSDILENLAWATVQIHCYSSSAISEKSISDTSYIKSSNDTSLNAAVQGQGDAIFTTNPRILFCDLRLAPGEIKSCRYFNNLNIDINNISNISTK